ncbi:diguanylate cyclase [Heliobacillus mobilis]|uniref:Stage 0 sporulation protein A homolog n=1 Tax=Heliobacterium mobile TaxID=28064 RepID=A0A6I3SMW9_HELMO|nr:diguanylate cyclase [Heliobacterium mobile]MTV50341.1 diguanylate cyclase [Heliobacterium mobile]
MHILIVDDAEDVRIYLDAILSKAGYQVTNVDSPHKALALLANGDAEVDLVLLDVMMPEMDGIEVCRIIKSQEVSADIPVIMVTALTNMDELERAFAAGAMDYITKPIKRVELLARIRSALTLKEEMDRRKAREEELLEVTRSLQEVVKKLKTLSALDGLTELANRRRFDEYIQAEWKRAVRNQRAFSLIMADIDFFKAYNDTYGHLGGDECLKIIARLLEFFARRPGDLACRYGGEEFALILPETDCDGALQLAEAIRLAVEERGIPHQASSITDKVTVSMGVVTVVPKPGDSLEAFIDRTDQALYEAKRTGRNRVESVCLL